MSGITLNFNTKKLSEKIKVVSRHLEAIAEEWEKVDDELCDECGGESSISEKEGYVLRECKNCAEFWVVGTPPG